MHRYLHIVTDIERLVDPDGQCFDTLASAVEEARQCARDLMAEELRQGRPLPLNWRVQVADETRRIAPRRIDQRIESERVHGTENGDAQSLAELLAARATPAEDLARWVVAFEQVCAAVAFAIPAVQYLFYFVAVMLWARVTWSVHLWTGAIVIAGGVGWLLSYLVLAPGRITPARLTDSGSAT